MLQTSAHNYQQEQEVNWKSWFPKRGEIYLIDLGQEGKGSEYRGLRPVVILSNNINNLHSTIIQVAPITSAQGKANIPVHVKLGVEDGLKISSFVSIEQTSKISKERGLINGKLIKITELNERKMLEIDLAIKIQFGLM